MILQTPLGTSILILRSLLLNKGGKDRERLFLENFQETFWIEQRMANNSFLPWTTDFHRQTSDSTTDMELMALKSHTGSFRTRMYAIAVSWP